MTTAGEQSTKTATQGRKAREREAGVDAAAPARALGRRFVKSQSLRASPAGVRLTQRFLDRQNQAWSFNRRCLAGPMRPAARRVQRIAPTGLLIRAGHRTAPPLRPEASFHWQKPQKSFLTGKYHVFIHILNVALVRALESDYRAR